MAQTLPIFFMDAPSPQGEGASDAGVAGETAIETGDGSGMFLASLNEAISTMPRDLIPGPALELFVAPAAPEQPPSEDSDAGTENNPLSGEGFDPSALTWENGCQVGLALGQENQPVGYTFSENEFAPASPLPQPFSAPVPVGMKSPLPVEVSSVNPVQTLNVPGPKETNPAAIIPEQKPVGNPVVPEFFQTPGLQVARTMTEPVQVPAMNPPRRETVPVANPELPVVETAVVSERPTLAVAETPKPGKPVTFQNVAVPLAVDPGLETSPQIQRVPVNSGFEIPTENPKITVRTVPPLVISSIPPAVSIIENDLPMEDPEPDTQTPEEIAKPAPTHPRGERFSSFTGGERQEGRGEHSRPDSESFPEWEISLRAESVRPEGIPGRHPLAESAQAPEPGAPAVFRAPLPQLPALLFQRLVETTGEMSRAESRHQEFVVQVEPEHLGRVQVAVEVHQGRIAARIAVDSDAVRQAMDAQLPALRHALEQQGLRLESIEVSVQDRHASLLNPEGRDSESFFHQRRPQGKGEAGNAEGEIGADSIIGETGRRFGFNTVEYFA